MKYKSIVSITLGLAAVGVVAASRSTPAESASGTKDYQFNRAGELIRPTGYREWIFVGTPVTPNDLNDGKAPFPEFHNVYIAPRAWKAWKATGEFPDGTILIKELVSVGSKAAVSGNGYFQGEYVGLEAEIKDAKRFAKEPGNWAYFSFTTEDHKSLKKAAKAFPTEACNTCHQASAADDFVFTQYYPVLRAGKKKGKTAVGGVSDGL